MENLVINRGNPRRVEIAVLGANGVQVELSRCTEVELVLWINGRSKRAQNVQTLNDILIAELSASELDYLGEYSAQVKYTDNGIRSTSERVYLFRVANEFYRTASNLSDNGNIAITVTTPQALNKGYSAYELAVQGGFAGTEEEWIASLSKDSKDAAIIALESAAKADKATSDSVAQTALSAKATLDANNATQSSISQTNIANIATSEANAARDKANTAATNADNKATLAQNNANLANTAATTANNSAVNADNKAALAVTATANANTATTNANTATTNANNAAANANAKATLANTAATNATNAANYTQGVGDSYEARMVESENKITNNTFAIAQLEQNVNLIEYNCSESSSDVLTLEEALLRIPSQILSKGLVIKFIDKYTNLSVRYVSTEGLRNRYDWKLIESMENLKQLNYAKLGYYSDCKLQDGFADNVNYGYYNKDGVLNTSSGYNKTIQLTSGNYILVHNAYSDFYSFIYDGDILITVLNGSFAMPSFNLNVPSGKIYTVKQSSTNRYFFVFKEMSVDEKLLNDRKPISTLLIAQMSNSEPILDSVLHLDNAYYDSSLKVVSNNKYAIKKYTLPGGTYFFISRDISSLFGKLVDDSDYLLEIFNSSYEGLFKIEVPIGSTYKLFTTVSKDTGFWDNLNSVVLKCNDTVNSTNFNTLLNYNMLLNKCLKDMFEVENIQYTRIPNSYYISSPTDIHPSPLLFRIEETVPNGLYRIRYNIGIPPITSYICDNSGNILINITNSSAVSKGLFDATIDFRHYTKDVNVKLYISVAVKNENYPLDEELIIERVEPALQKSTPSMGDVDFLGDVNVTPIHGQSLSLGIVHAVPPIHTYKDSFGLMFNEHVNQVGCTSDTLLSISDLYEKREETSAYGTSTAIKQCLLKSMNYNSLGKRCIYLTTGKDGGAFNLMSKPSTYYNSIIASMTRAKQLNNGKTVKIPCVYIIQGESEIATGYDKGAYKNELYKFRDDIQSDAYNILQQDTPVKAIIYQVGTRQWLDNGINIQMAHLEAVLENENFVMSTPMYILDYVSDQVHINARNEYILGAYQGVAYYKSVVLKQRALPLYCKKIEKIADNKLLLRFNVPYPPLKFDATIVSQIENNGFKVIQNELNIASSVELYMDDSVIITCSATINACEVSYGYFPEISSKSGRINGARGNLRDSQGDLYKIPMVGEEDYRLDNYSAIFKMNFL